MGHECKEMVGFDNVAEVAVRDVNMSRSTGFDAKRLTSRRPGAAGFGHGNGIENRR